jgi:hypothetical protein
MTPENPEGDWCAICGEVIQGDDCAEMYNPHDDDSGSFIVHPECGIGAGMEVA